MADSRWAVSLVYVVTASALARSGPAQNLTWCSLRELGGHRAPITIPNFNGGGSAVMKTVGPRGARMFLQGEGGRDYPGQVAASHSVPAPLLGAQDVYSWDFDTFTLAKWADPPSGGVTPVGSGFNFVNELCFSPDGTLYGFDGSDIVAIDLTTGLVSNSYPITSTIFGLGERLEALSFSPGGVLYALTSRGNTNSLYTFDLAAGTATAVVRDLAGPYFGMTFAPDGRLFATNFFALLVLDPSTGAVVKTVGNMSEPVDFLAWAPDGYLLGETALFDGAGLTSYLYAIDSGSAAVTILGSSPDFLNSVAAIAGEPRGACCDAATGHCAVTTQSDCATTWTPPGVCSPNPCPQPPAGACCSVHGTCLQTVQASCDGLWSEAVLCAPNPCVQPNGSCCNAVNGECLVTMNDACTTGPWTEAAACEPDPCFQPPGACCLGISCEVMLPDACVGPGSHFAGSGSVCNAPGNDAAPCCRADVNQSGHLTVQDLFEFLSAYFNKTAGGDFNSDGVDTPVDVLDFVAAFFAGCG